MSGSGRLILLALFVFTCSTLAWAEDSTPHSAGDTGKKPQDKCVAQSEMNEVKDEIEQLKKRLIAAEEKTNNIGVVFTFWGGISCPTGAELLYTGIMVGSSRHGGGGAGFMCLEQLIIDKKPTGATKFVSTITGIEIRGQGEDYINKLWTLYHKGEAIKYHKITDQNVMCSVCYRPGKSSQLMVPARSDCVSKNHTLEYSGYLVGGRSDDPEKMLTREYVCLSQKLEVKSGGYLEDQEAGEVLPVQMKCHQLRCSKGSQGTNVELPCSVCTF